MFVKFTGPPLFLCALSRTCLIALTTLVPGMAVFAQDKQTDIPAKKEHSAYVQESSGLIVRSSDGLCWRSGYWTTEDAVAGCDGPIAPPISKMIAPPVTTDPAPVTTTRATPTALPTRPVAAPCEFSLTLEGDQAFAFNRAELNAAARRQLAQEVLPRVDQCPGTPAIRVVGHTDRLGPASYNRQLSLRRAQAVARHLEELGAEGVMEIIGAGASQARQQCEATNTRGDLLACLAPDRRVDIHIRGTQN